MQGCANLKSANLDSLGVDRQMQVGKVLGEQLQAGHHFQARQVLSGTGVYAGIEGSVRLELAMNVEDVRVLPTARIPVRDPLQDRQVSAPGNLAVTDHHVFRRQPRSHEARRRKAKPFLNRPTRKIRVLADIIILVAMGEDLQQHQRQAAPGGLDARREDKASCDGGFRVVENSLVVFLRGHEIGERILSGLPFAFLDLAEKEIEKFIARLRALFHVDAGGEELFPQCHEGRQLILRYAEHRAHGFIGKRQGEITNQAGCITPFQARNHTLDQPFADRPNEPARANGHGVHVQERIVEVP